MKWPNQTMQRTATAARSRFPMIKTLQLRLVLAPLAVADLALGRPMRTVPLLIALAINWSAAKDLPFYGDPRDPMLRDFWVGVQESAVNTAWFKNRCFSFARRHKAEVAIPALLRDFAAYPGETKGSRTHGSCMGGRERG